MTLSPLVAIGSEYILVSAHMHKPWAAVWSLKQSKIYVDDPEIVEQRQDAFARGHRHANNT